MTEHERAAVLDIDTVVREGIPEVDLVVVPVFSDERPLRGLGAVLDWRARGRLTSMVDRALIEGEPDDAVLTPAPFPGFARLVLVGLGRRDALTDDPASVAETVVRVVRGLRPRSLACDVPYGRAASDVCDTFTRALVRGLEQPGVHTWLVVPGEAVTRTRRVVGGPLRATDQAAS